MTGGDGEDPWELDPFGEQEYDPALAFALVAATQANEKVADAEAMLAREVAAFGHHTNAVATSARKSALLQLESLKAVAIEVARLEEASRTATPDSPEQMAAVNDTVETFNTLIAAYDELLVTINHVLTPDHPPVASPKAALPPIQDPLQASAQIESDLRAWIRQRRGNDLGDMVVVKATPGVGKTRAMIRIAYEEQQARQRVAYAVRTTSMIIGPNPEAVERMHAASPLKRVHLVTICGRNPDNCWEHQTVQAVQAHGYAPGQAVCLKCDHYPDNARVAGMAICPYYEERIRAHNLSRGARIGTHQHYPIVMTTQASVVSAFGDSGGGRWNGFWSSDLIMIDEDPTDALETDILLSEEQTDFNSAQPHNRAATAASALLRKAIAIGKQERVDAAGNGYRAPGKKEMNTHTVHSRYDTAYTGDDLHQLLQRAASTLRTTMRMPPLTQVLRDVSEAQSFTVQAGELAGVQSVDDINAMHVPPRALGLVAEDIHREMNHSLGLRRLIYEKIRGRPPKGHSLDEIIEALEKETAVAPVSYTARLECLPADVTKGREKDEWRYVIRTVSDLLNNTATLVIGDAYAQKEHYEQVFHRDADVIDRVSMLHADTTIVRILDDGCHIGELRKGGLQRVLANLEALMPEEVRDNRVLVYGHEELRPKVEAWLAEVAGKRGIAEWAYEHWWGGRGKDEYNGWEFTYCISDPIQSLSGIAHVANARAFRESLRATDVDDKISHGRKIEVQVGKHGVIRALSSGHPRLAMEHERQNVAELTQAMHRSRPVHHGVSVTVLGESEQSVDLIAQTKTIVPDTYRKERVSGSRRKKNTKTRQVVGTIDAFVSPREVQSAIRGIIDWFGVFSPLFSHALLTSAVTSPIIPPNLEKIINDSGVNSVVLREEPFKTTELTPTSLPFSGWGAEPPDLLPGDPTSLPGDADRSAPDGAPLEAAPNLGTVLDRVWNPPVYWQLLISQRSLPKAVREALLELPKRDDLRSVQATRWAGWQEGFKTVRGGRRPMVYHDPSTPAHEALDLFFDIVDNQYGPVVDGKLFRPNARPELPPMRWKDVPF